MNEENEKGEEGLRSSQSSINSNPELKETKISFFRISLIIINVISIILGYYIFQNKEYYLSKNYNFEYIDSLSFFIILYSLGMIGSFIFSFLLSIIIKIFLFFVNIFYGWGDSAQLNKNEEKPSENSFRYINSHSNEFSLFPYTISIFIIITSLIYLLSLPYSIFLLIFINKNEFYNNLNEFRLLYFFIIINTIAGLFLFYIILIVVFAKREGSFRHRNYFIDDNNLKNLKNEVKEAMDKANEHN